MFSIENSVSNYFWSTFVDSILKAIKNATGTSVVFPVDISFIHYVLVLTSVPNIGERFTKTWAQLHTSAKKFGETWQINQFFW